MPERYIGKLSDSYARLDKDGEPDISLKLKVLVININGCYNEDTIGKAINQYLKNNALREFLEKERAEVMALSNSSMCMILWIRLREDLYE